MTKFDSYITPNGAVINMETLRAANPSVAQVIDERMERKGDNKKLGRLPSDVVEYIKGFTGETKPATQPEAKPKTTPTTKEAPNFPELLQRYMDSGMSVQNAAVAAQAEYEVLSQTLTVKNPVNPEKKAPLNDSKRDNEEAWKRVLQRRLTTKESGEIVPAIESLIGKGKINVIVANKEDYNAMDSLMTSRAKFAPLMHNLIIGGLLKPHYNAESGIVTGNAQTMTKMLSYVHNNEDGKDPATVVIYDGARNISIKCRVSTI